MILPAILQSQTNPDSSLSEILKEIRGTPLTIKQAVQSGMTKSTAVRKSEAAYFAAAGTVRRESGFFDPALFFSINHADQKLPTASFFSGAPILSTQQTTSEGGIRMNLSTGTQLQISLSTISTSTNSSFAFLNPEYDVTGVVSLRQPLLGGFMASARKRLTQSEQQLDAAKARYDQAVLNTTTEIEMRYWDLYASERDYAVQILTRDRASEFFKETELRARTGLIGPNQVASAKTFLAEQEIFLLDRQEEFERLSDQLASLIGVRPEGVPGRYIPGDAPPEDFPRASDDDLINHAVQGNLDLNAAMKDIEGARALANAASWEALPSIDLVGSLGANGLAGTGNTVVIFSDTLPVPRTATLGDAITQAGKRRYPSWTVGVEISVPIGSRTGWGEKDRLDAVVTTMEQDYTERLRNLQEQILTANRELSNGKQRLQFARQDVDAAQEQVRIGMIEFHNGRSTAFELVRLGEDLASAQQRYSSALVRTARAATTLRQLTSGWYPPQQ